MEQKIKIVFMGTPEFAVPYLRDLIGDNNFEVVAVITQTDKPSGRKQIITPSPIKILALQNNIEVLQPEKLRDDKKIESRLKEIKANLSVVVAYGQIIPQEILDIFKLGNINVHPSLLPKYRGASPIQNAILNNETSTGLTIMLMDEKMDHGPILDQMELALKGSEDNESLHQKMSDENRTDFLIATIKRFITGIIKPKYQNHDQATFCKLIKKEEAKIDWTNSAKNISAKIRAFYPWPIAWTILEEKRVKIFPPITIIDIKKQPGEIFESDKNLAIGCGKNSLLINELQIEGKNKISAKDFLAGNNISGKYFR